MRPWRSWIARHTPTLKAAGSNPVGRTKWMRVGVLNSFLRLSNTPTLILWKKA